MEALIETAFNNIRAYNWDSPFTLVIVFLAGLLIMRKWSLFIILFSAIVFGWVARDLIVWSLKIAKEIIGVPLIIYCVGGFLFMVLLFIKIIKYSID